MKINSLSAQNFGKIYIDKTKEKELYSRILSSSCHNDTYKETITDILHVGESKRDNVYVKSDGSVWAKSDYTNRELNRMMTNDILENFLMALRIARSDKYQSFLTNFKNNNSNVIDI